VVSPVLGFGIKGIIWYQGESNAERANEYGQLFPVMIKQWRREWGQGEFPFYWAQLPNYKDRVFRPGDSDWAELRESQTRALALPRTGQAITIDLGEGKNIHPTNKAEVAARLVRWALARDYGIAIAYRSPEFKRVIHAGGKPTVRFDCFGSTLKTVGTVDVQGFAICGSDRIWHWARGRILNGEDVELWSPDVPQAMEVRYAWADNPACNLYANNGLPVAPFRTDDFDPITEKR
jgi:sialate O-acetylesterase